MDHRPSVESIPHPAHAYQKAKSLPILLRNKLTLRRMGSSKWNSLTVALERDCPCKRLLLPRVPLSSCGAEAAGLLVAL
jgi:hypothetical protein